MTPESKTTLEDISVEMQLGWYRQMFLIRAFEREVYQLNTSGLVRGTAHLYIGMEAIAVGACAAMREEDLLTSTHRGHGHCIGRHLDLNRMIAEILGRSDGTCGGKGGSMHIADISLGMLGADGIVGGGIPIAVGAALGGRLKNSSSVVFCFFGEGASNQGSFHEALNLASVQRLPVVFICENNLWALSAGFTDTTAGGSVANRAKAYGIPGRNVDGNDVCAVFGATCEAAVRARQGLGPSLLEFASYRWEGHSIFARRELRPEDEIQQWKQRDPILRLRTQLLEVGGVRTETLEEIEAAVGTEIAEAVRFAKGSPLPDPLKATEHIYNQQ
jgi:TPP-dependent pyruvate/acetoin dehydrogenase alpha subunit